MGYSERKTDLLGNEYIQHYDDNGNKTGYSSTERGFFGDYTQHYSQSGEKEGCSEKETGLFGYEFIQHYSESGEKTGYSQDEQTLFDGYRQGHYDQSGNQEGTSTFEKGLFGSYKQHRWVEKGRPGAQDRTHQSRGGGGCGGGSGTNAGTGIVLTVLGALVGGVVICCGLIGHSDKPRPQQRQPSTGYDVNRLATRPDLTLGENIEQFSRYLRERNQLPGNFEDYQLVLPPAVIRDKFKSNNGSQSYEIAYEGSSALYTFHSADGGVTWGSMPPSDPFLLEHTRNRGKVKPDTNESRSDNEERVELQEYDWDTSRLSHSLYRDEKATLHWWLKEDLGGSLEPRGVLEGLAKAVRKQADGCQTTIYDYSQKAEHLWAAGAYSTSHKWNSGEQYRNAGEEDKAGAERGFICYSPDNGKTWVRQWFSESGHAEPVYGIYFSDSSEGWALTLRGILHTSNGGSFWKRALETDSYSISNLFILGQDRLIVTETRPYFYFSVDRASSWTRIETTSEYKRKLDDLVENCGGRRVRYGGIYSKQEGDEPAF